MMDPLFDQVSVALAGRYTLVRVLGQGVAGEVEIERLLFVLELLAVGPFRDIRERRWSFVRWAQGSAVSRWMQKAST